jgi:hypothetical protein
MAVEKSPSTITSYHLENWNPKTYEQIHDDPTASLYERCPSGVHGNTLVEATVNTK